jgi:hypothetical protein
VQHMWSEVGFKVALNLYEQPVLLQKRRDRDFYADSTAGSYRWDPDGWFSRTSSHSPTEQRQWPRVQKRKS